MSGVAVFQASGLFLPSSDDGQRKIVIDDVYIGLSPKCGAASSRQGITVKIALLVSPSIWSCSGFCSTNGKMWYGQPITYRTPQIAGSPPAPRRQTTRTLSLTPSE